MTTEPDPVAAVLAGDYFDFRLPLASAWRWNRSGKPDELEYARRLLEALAEEFPDALPVKYEQAFNLVKREKNHDAVTLLADVIAPRFGPSLDEDTLSLWGRCLKNEADAHLVPGPGDAAAAAARYADAEAIYDRAYAIRRDRFPGINVATLRLLQAALLKQRFSGAASAATQNRDEADRTERRISELHASSKQRASELLADRPNWEARVPDDVIWMAATEAEALVILGDWAGAESNYRFALRPENHPLPHHPSSMKDQLKRLVAATSQLVGEAPEPLNNPDTFFAALTPAKV